MGINPNPELDQHFLVNRENILKIVDSADISEKDSVVEIGAGIGTITKHIPKCKRLVAIEIDPILMNSLKKVKRSDIEIVNGNALEVMERIKFDKLISSTPYSICEPLLQKLFIANFKAAVLVLPEGFVNKMVNKKNLLGLFAGHFFHFEVIGLIPKENFKPKPRVNSIIVKIKKKNEKSVLKELYLQRDKKIKNALREAFCRIYRLTKRQAEEKVKKLGLNKDLLEERFEKLSYDKVTNLERFLK